ncbi:MAG: TetR/AcrR family transcriptional regulator [Candidatus Dormibacteraeota bacterium]|nr:TetR/AcrR family transcriptional regulator [Candidatus Dormibacteraeota bacterium]
MTGQAQSIPRSRRRLSADERRIAILTAAKRVFGEAGYHETTTRDIAVAAGVSEALLYQHFPGKRQLFEELVHWVISDLEARLLAARESDHPTTAGLEAYFAFAEEESGLYRVFFREALQADPAFRPLYVQLSRRLVHLMDVENAISEAATRALAGLITELALWWTEERPMTRDEVVQRAARMVCAICDSEG